MRIKRLKLKILLILLFPLALMVRELLYLSPSATEQIYSKFLYPPIGKLLSRITGLLPISLAELLLYVIIAAAIIKLIKFIYLLFKSSSKLQAFFNGILNLFCFISITYCLFLLLWGFNYYRQPLSYSIGYNVEKSSVADLKELCSALIDRTNELREDVQQNDKGIMYLDLGFENAVKRADIGYQNLSSAIPILSGSYGRPKGIVLSRQLCFTGIAGIYIPFTGEANVNKLVPDFMLPATICHEMAHQRGFAREDEANFIAYLTCKAHRDSDFQYSGYLLAVIYSMNALHQYDIEGYKELSLKYSEAVKRDLKYNSDFWKQFDGPAEELQVRINDTYLKSNKQPDGIYSYGRMVDLLLAEHKKI